MKEKPYIIDGERVSKDEYNKRTLDRFLISVPKGKKDLIHARAKELGKSLNSYINGLIEDDMKLTE